jgi:AraC-like DNA-binding protein
MEKEQEKLSKSHNSVSARLLFVHVGLLDRSVRIERHSHPFFQLEIGQEGSIALEDDNRRGSLAPCEGVLFPPERSHAFNYPGDPVRWISFKFECEIPGRSGPAARISPDDEAGPLLQTLVRLAPQAAREEPGATGLSESILAALVRYLSAAPEEGSQPSAGATSPFVRRIRSVLAGVGGRGISVSALAEQLNLSPGHVSNRFRSEHGGSLKAYMDRTRYSYIERLLEHADMPVKMIAAQCGFPDIYGFSRFVKRMSGLSPRAVRARASSARP